MKCNTVDLSLEMMELHFLLGYVCVDVIRREYHFIFYKRRLHKLVKWMM